MVPSASCVSLQADAIERLRVLLQRRQVFVLDDRGRHVPGRVDGDEFHLRADHRRRLARLSGHDLGVPVDLVVVVERQGVIRHVDDHVRIAEVARQPAPALHVDDDGVDRIGGRPVRDLLLAVERAHGVGAEIAVDVDVGFGLERLHRVAHGVVIERIVLVAGDVEALAQRHHALILHADVQGLAFADMHKVRLLLFLGLGRQRALAQFGELGLERLEFRLRRIVAVERGAHVAGVGELGQHLGRLRRDQLEFDVGADAAEVDAAGLRLARIGEDGSGELELVLGLRARRSPPI